MAKFIRIVEENGYERVINTDAIVQLIKFPQDPHVNQKFMVAYKDHNFFSNYHVPIDKWDSVMKQIFDKE